MNRPPGRRDRAKSTDGRLLDRRQLLRGVAIGGGTVLAGCTDSVTGGDPSIDAHDSAWIASFDGHLDDLRLAQPTGLLATVSLDVGFARDPTTRDPVFVLAEGVEETETSVSITLKPGLEWSNGDPLTAADIGRWVYMFRTASSSFIEVPEIRDGTRRPRSSWEAITDVEWDETTVTVRGAFDTVPRPTFELNTHLGSHPRTYYRELWEEFEAAYDDEPWEDERTRAAVTSLVDENIWAVGDERLPAAGIHLEDEYDGDGWEAAYSGLWYPYRTEGSDLHFTVNESHPFADRVQYDEVVWTFRGEPDASLGDIRRGVVDGAMRSDVSDYVVENAPSSVASFDGQAAHGTALTLNHATYHLGDRDVRAALSYAIDRSTLVEALATVTSEAVTVPGADLQAESWAAPGSRDQLRSYAYEPDRARTLLERSGFRRDGDAWKTPDGETFEFVVLTDENEPTLELAIVDQLRDFGIDASMRSLEQTSYETRLDAGYFVATTDVWSSPNATGLPRNRAGEYVRSIAREIGFSDSTFLRETVSEAVESDDDLYWVPAADGSSRKRCLGFDSIEALRSVTVEAPPLGEPEGELREWPYLYHAVKSAGALDATESTEHANICTWVYNYQLPRLELVIDVPRIFHDTVEWDVPAADEDAWQYVRNGRHPGGLWAALSWGHVDAA